MSYQLTIPATKTRPRPQERQTRKMTALLQIVGQNFSMSTWILAGACIQAVAVLIAPNFRYILLPAFIILGLRILDSVLMANNIIPNRFMKDVFLGRRTAIIPDENGAINPNKREKVTILLLGAKSNHPYGLFAPQFAETGNWLMKMSSMFDSKDAPKGFLGQTNWSRKDERGAIEFTLISYWRSIEDLHEFAHGPLHRDAWNWWEKTIKENDYVGINHEIFEAEPGHFENVYVNFQPTGVGATSFLRKGEKIESGKVDDEWIIPLVDARRGKLAKSSARLGQADTKYDADRPAADIYAS